MEMHGNKQMFHVAAVRDAEIAELIGCHSEFILTVDIS
jgi:hypothetical protein